MSRPIVYLKALGYIAASLALTFFVYVIADTFSPLYQALQMKYVGGSPGRSLGLDEICADLLKGDYAAASRPIARKTAAHEFRLADTITWLANKGGRPFAEIPRSPLFTELPSDQGPMRSCRPQASATLSGELISTSIFLEYPKSRLTVTLRYSTGWLSPTLELIEFGKPEPLSPGMPQPDETDRRMGELMRKLE